MTSVLARHKNVAHFQVVVSIHSVAYICWILFRIVFNVVVEKQAFAAGLSFHSYVNVSRSFCVLVVACQRIATTRFILLVHGIDIQSFQIEIELELCANFGNHRLSIELAGLRKERTQFLSYIL